MMAFKNLRLNYLVLSLMVMQVMTLCPTKYEFKGQNTCIPGHDIRGYTGKTLAECQQICDDDDRCLQYDYNGGACWAGNAIGPINYNCGGWKSFEKKSGFNDVECMKENDEIVKEMAEIKAVMKFMGSKINDTDSK